MERGDGGGGMAQRGGGGGGGVVGSAAMLGLDMHLAPQQMLPAAAFQHQAAAEHHHGGFQLQQPAPPVRHQQQQQPSSFSPYSNTSSSRGVVGSAGVGHDDDMVGNGFGGGKVQQQQQQMAAAAGCPWSRMKWTDSMVRLLITVVYNVGDDGDGVAAAASGGAGGGKPGRSAHGHGHGHAAAAQQQKKGKWKSVSQAMMEKSFTVSPQQCEDKFNDLNKRYKRVIDLLGRGRACRVVENPALLDAIDDLSPKAKDEARKLLSSKHLFFREMCAYHNGGGGHAPPHAAAAGDAACLHHPPPAPAARHTQQQQHATAPSPPATLMSNNGDEDEDEDYDDDEDDGHGYPLNHRPTTTRVELRTPVVQAPGADRGAPSSCGRSDDGSSRTRSRATWRARPLPPAAQARPDLQRPQRVNSVPGRATRARSSLEQGNSALPHDPCLDRAAPGFSVPRTRRTAQRRPARRSVEGHGGPTAE